METHRYTRQLATHSSDSYNSFSDLQNNSSSPVEYWTNGTTHLMSSTPKSTATTTSPPLPPTRTITPIQQQTTPAFITSNNTNKKDNVIRNSLMAGSVAGMTSTAVLYPLDVLRTKMQSAGMERAAVSGLSVSTTNNNARGGPWTVLTNTVQHGGIRALYTGLALPLAAQAIYKGTVFTVNNVTQSVLMDYRTWENQKTGIMQPGQLTDGDRFLCGAMGGGLNAALFVTPVEFVRNQLIAQHSKRAAGATNQMASTTFQVIAKTAQHGMTSLWRGVGWSVGRDALGCGCFFYSLAVVQRLLTVPGEAPTPTTTMVAGGVAGLAFWVSALPLDTVKTWVQSSDLTARVCAKSSVQKIYVEGGLPAVVHQLFRGWQVAYTRGIPSAAITMTIYSRAYQYLEGSAR